MLIKAVANAENMHTPTIKAITEEFQTLSKTPVTENWIEQKLHDAENAGLIKRTVISKGDKPAIAWKSQINSLSPFKMLKGLFIG